MVNENDDNLSYNLKNKHEHCESEAYFGKNKSKIWRIFFQVQNCVQVFIWGEKKEKQKQKKQKQNICIHITNTYINVECTFILKKQANCLL